MRAALQDGIFELVRHPRFQHRLHGLEAHVTDARPMRPLVGLCCENLHAHHVRLVRLGDADLF